MKTKLVILALLGAISINVAAKSAANGQVGVGYATESYFRGAQNSEEALKVQAGANAAIGDIDVFVDVLSIQSNDESNTDFVTLGLGKKVSDTLSLYAGVLNVNPEGASSNLDAFISANLDVALSPSVSVYRNTDDNLYTFEGSVSKSFDLGIADLEVSGALGSTDLAAGGDRTYGGVAGKLSKTIDSLTVYADVSLIDVEDLDVDTVVTAGVSFKF